MVYIGIQLHSVVYGYPVAPALFIEKKPKTTTTLSLLNCLALSNFNYTVTFNSEKLSFIFWMFLLTSILFFFFSCFIHSFIHSFFYPHPKTWLLICFREREREGKREGDNHPCERETLISCLLYAPQLGVEPAT